MSVQDINHLFNLPPAPAKNAFSSLDPSRVRFPDFNSPHYLLPNGERPTSPAFAARSFMRGLFHFGEYWSRSTFIQFKIIGTLAACLFILFCWVLAKRVKKKTFWIFRLVKRPNGTLCAPNATVGFTAFEGIYAIALIAFLCEFSRFEKGMLPKGTLVWSLVTWSPLITGAWFGLIGTIFAIPTRSKKSNSFWKTVWKAALSPRPLIINLICLFIPIIQITTIIVPAATSNSAYYKSTRRWRDWDSKYSSETEISQEMLQEAYDIWEQALDAYLVVAIGFTIWLCWALLITTAYGVCGITLLKTIGDQIRKLREAGIEDNSSSPSASPFTPSIPLTSFTSSSRTAVGSPIPKTPMLDPKWQNEAVASGRLERNGSIKSLAASQGTDSSQTYTTPSSKPYHQSSKSLSKIDTNSRTALRKWAEDEDDHYRSSTTDLLPIAEKTSDLVFSDKEIVEDLPHNSFFPPMRPSAFASFRRQQAHQAPVDNKPRKWNLFNRKDDEEKGGKVRRTEIQARFLEKVYYNFLVNFCAKFAAEVAFSAVALYLTLEFYAAAELNDVGKPVEIAILWVGYASILFGSITLGTIAVRQYEPATQAYLLLSEQNRAKRPSELMHEMKRSTSLPRLARKVSRSLLHTNRLRSTLTVNNNADDVLEISPTPAGKLAERRTKRGRNLGLGIDETLSSSPQSHLANTLLIQQTVDQVIDLDSSPGPNSAPSPSQVPPAAQRSAHARLDSSSTAYSLANEDSKQQGGASPMLKLSRYPSRSIFLPYPIADVEDEVGSSETAFSPSTTAWSPWIDPQSPYINDLSTPSPNQVNSDHFYGPFDSSINMDGHQHPETTFPSAPQLANSPTRSLQRQDSSHSISDFVLSSSKNAWRPNSPTRFFSHQQTQFGPGSGLSHQGLEIQAEREQPRKLSWSAPIEWGSPSPDQQLVAEQERLERDRKR